MMKKMLLLFAICCSIGSSCSKDEFSNETMPTSFINGDIIHFIKEWSDDNHGVMCLECFFVSGPTTGQWDHCMFHRSGIKPINPDVSSATYTYSVIGDNLATLTSRNYQATTCRSWYMDVTMTYETARSGTYECYERCSTGEAHNIKGRFEINPTNFEH